MKRIKWIEAKNEDFRGNWTQWAFRFDNSPYTFEFNSYMTYKGFKRAVRNMAQHYEASAVTICVPWQGTQQEHVDASYWIIVGRNYHYITDIDDKEVTITYRFYKELVVPAGALRQFKDYDEAVIFSS